MRPIATIIGHIRKDDQQVKIVIENEFCDALLNLDLFSHIIVLWWISGHDNPRDRSILHVTPPVANAETSGVFAARSPVRPTPIGLSVVKILEVLYDECTIVIDQIDAHDETPVIDIKPYMPSSDRVDGARVPHWFENNIRRYSKGE